MIERYLQGPKSIIDRIINACKFIFGRSYKQKALKELKSVPITIINKHIKDEIDRSKLELDILNQILDEELIVEEESPVDNDSRHAILKSYSSKHRDNSITGPNRNKDLFKNLSITAEVYTRPKTIALCEAIADKLEDKILITNRLSYRILEEIVHSMLMDESLDLPKNEARLRFLRERQSALTELNKIESQEIVHCINDKESICTIFCPAIQSNNDSYDESIELKCCNAIIKLG